MKNKYLVSAVVLSSFLMSSVAPAIAKDRPSPSVRPDTEKQQQQQEKRKGQLKKWWTNTAKRLGNIIEQQNKIADKIQKRIDMLKERGRDVTQLQKDLDAAHLKMEAAKKALTDATAQAESILTTGTSQQILQKMKELHKSVITSIRAAHAALVKVLASTRGLSTATVTPTPAQ